MMMAPSRLRFVLAIAAGVAVATASPAQEAPTFSSEELEQIVAPIALYPDSLLAQVFMASTYPLEAVEAARFVKENPKLEGQALDEKLKDQTWDDSVKALVPFPQVLEMMSDKLDWTQKLGDAFLAQQKETMAAVQTLRAKAKAEGNLESNEQQKIVIEQAPAEVVVEQAPPTIIQIESANPQVVYVPTYNPTVVYGAWPYPAYPPYYYYPPGYVATSMLSFGLGMAVASSWGWGGCNWGGGDIDIDIDRNFNYNKNVNRNATRNTNRNWNHDASHRKGVGYRDKATQQKFGKDTRANASSREAFRGRAEQGRQDLARPGGADKAQRDLAKAGGASRDLGKAGAGAGTRDLGKGGSQLGSGKGSSKLGSSGRTPSSFEGMGKGSQVRHDSSRGHASRQSAKSWGGSKGGGGGGGHRGGGGGGGGRGGRR
jgi:hypothetical protein